MGSQSDNAEQRALEFLAAEYERDGKTGSAEHIRTQPLLPNKARAVRAIVAAIRQQQAPTDLEQFREAVECWRDAALPANDVEAKRKAESKHLLSIIDSAGKVEVLARGWFHRLPDGDYDIHDEASGAGKDCDGCIPCLIVAQDATHQPAPVVDDAMVERYLTAVHEHLGGLPREQWNRYREDGGATLRRIARIGLTAALACEKPVPVTASG